MPSDAPAAQEDADQEAWRGAEAAKRLAISTQYNILTEATNHFSFAMGMAWKAFVLLVVTDDYFIKAPPQSSSSTLAPPLSSSTLAPPQASLDRDRLGLLWLITLLVVACVLPAILLLNWRKAALQREADTMVKAGKTLAAMNLTCFVNSYNVLVTWGLAFAAASQLDSAVNASLPLEPVGWRVLYFALSVVGLGIPVTALHIWAPRGSLMASLADSLIVGSGFVFALAFTLVVEAVLELGSIATSERVGEIVAYFLAFGLVCALAIWACAAIEERTTEARLRRLEQPASGYEVGSTEEQQQSEQHTLYYVCGRQCHTGCVLTAQGVSMACANVIYLLFWVIAVRLSAGGDSQISVYDPMQPVAALAMYAVALALQLTVSKGLDIAKKKGQGRLQAIDCSKIAGKIEDAIVALLTATSKTWMQAVNTGLAWVAGQALHNFVQAIWQKQVRPGVTQPQKVLMAGAYSVCMTFLAVVAIFFLPKLTVRAAVHPESE